MILLLKELIFLKRICYNHDPDVEGYNTLGMYMYMYTILYICVYSTSSLHKYPVRTIRTITSNTSNREEYMAN